MEVDESNGSEASPWRMRAIIGVGVMFVLVGYIVQYQNITSLGERDVLLAESVEEEEKKARLAGDEMGEKISQLTGELEDERALARGATVLLQTVQQELTVLKEHKEEGGQWKKMVSQVLETTQDVYAIKMAVNKPVLAELESESGRAMEICERWEVLVDALGVEGGFTKEVALLKIRLAQTYAGEGMAEKINLEEIDWKAAEMEAKQADISMRIYYALTDRLLNDGKVEMAMEYLARCREFAAKLPADGYFKDYAEGGIHLLEARGLAKNPREAMDHYMKAIEKLRKVAVGLPGNLAFRCRFAEACLDGALIVPAGSSIGHAEKLRKEAHAHAYWLAKKHPELKIAHRINAYIDLEMAEEQLRGGQEGMVEPLLARAEESLEQAGGDVALTAGIAAVRSFMLWDRGQRAKAHTMMSSEIEKLRKYGAEHPKDVEVSYRLASLLWERSSMRADQGEALKDGHAAAQVLVELIKKGAGKRDAASRRVLAIIFGDIGHLALSAGQKDLAKQYFEQALAQWGALREKWGDSDEYAEGIRWCQKQLKEL